jgi:hypothetical protein
MKIKLALTAALIGLGSHAAYAASEGGDTWTSVAPAPHARSTPIMVATIAGLDGLLHAGGSPYGTPTAPEASDRVVLLGPGMRSIDVAYGERVTFMSNDGHGVRRSFAWRFDVSPMNTHVDLNDVAPPEFPAGGIRVFVAAQPEYRGG